jgi:hypothetical protein
VRPTSEFFPTLVYGSICITVDLDIPLKDNIKGWRLEWFIMENHGKSLPPRSGRQPDVRTPSWIESPNALEVTEARVLLAEICLLKKRGLTTEAIVADFVFKNIQPLKDRAYPAYLYSGVTNSTQVTNRRIPTEDLVSRLDMILRGKVSNVGAPVVYSAWNLPPPKSFSVSCPILLLVIVVWVLECDPLLNILKSWLLLFVIFPMMRGKFILRCPRA